MRVVTQNSITSGDSSASSITGSAINASQLINSYWQVICSASDAAGTVKIQMSNDLPPDGNMASGYTPTHWSDIPSATSAVSSGAGPCIVLANMSAQWVRAVYTKSGGGAASSMSVVMNAQGI